MFDSIEYYIGAIADWSSPLLIALGVLVIAIMFGHAVNNAAMDNKDREISRGKLIKFILAAILGIAVWKLVVQHAISWIVGIVLGVPWGIVAWIHGTTGNWLATLFIVLFFIVWPLAGLFGPSTAGGTAKGVSAIIVLIRGK